jgi:hypothetical protein
MRTLRAVVLTVGAGIVGLMAPFALAKILAEPSHFPESPYFELLIVSSLLFALVFGIGAAYLTTRPKR